jgi:tetratricopeptide (TPR) repeat protein
MKTRTLIRTASLLVVLAAGALPACSTPHSQQVRNEARDRFDRAGAQIAYDQARQSFNAGQFEQAMGNIDRAIIRFPKESSYFLLRGRILNEMKRADEARESFARAIELDPRKPEPHYFMGIVYQRWRQLDDALREYAKAAELDPAKLHYVSAEIEVLTALGRLQEADDRLASIATRFEYSPVIDRLRADVAKVRGSDVDCASLLERAAVREDSKPDLMEELAFAKYASRDWSGTIATLDAPELKAVRTRPDLVRLRARCLLMMGRAAEARDVLLPIREVADADGRTQILLGNASWRCGDWARLRECGENLVAANPMLADGYLFLGGAYYAAGNFTQAAVNFEQAVARDPERSSCRRLLMECTERMAQRGGTTGPRAERTLPAAGAVRTEAP